MSLNTFWAHMRWDFKIWKKCIIDQRKLRVNRVDARKRDGRNTLSIIPLRTHTSNIILDHPTIQTIVHNLPNPPPILLPVRIWYQRSHMIPTPIIRKKPQTRMKSWSPPLPIPQTPTAWTIPEIKKLPITRPVRPHKWFNGRPAAVRKICRKTWCHLLPQKSANEVDDHGELKIGGQYDGSFRRKSTAMSARRV